MKVREFMIKKHEDSKGPRDFRIPISVHENYLDPIKKGIAAYSVEINEIVLYSISIAVKYHEKDLGTNNLKNIPKMEESKESTALFGISTLDSDKLEFLMCAIIYLFGPESILDYKDTIDKLQNLAIEGLKLLHEKYENEYHISPSKFIDEIVNN
jgi:hypothetical protein